MASISDLPSDIAYAIAKKVERRRQGSRRKLQYRVTWEKPMDDVQIFKTDEMPKNEVVLGVYGSEEWIHADNLRKRHLAGLQTLETHGTWLTQANFSLSKWVVSMGFPSFTFFHHQKVIIPIADGRLLVEGSKGKIQVVLSGEIAFCEKWEAFFDQNFKRAENLIDWVYNARGDTISVPLNYRPAIQSAYPWIEMPIEQYIAEYLDSSANVLILIGPPGTGKTTFIKNLIHQSKTNAKVAYDQKVLEGDDFFAGFIEDECRFLIMEDADTFLESRQDGNSMMHKFLNVSDGLISAADKKIVFSTNLPNVRDIDSALLREGRCFDVLQFRPLTRKEAQAVYDEVGNREPLPDGSEFTLAELFNSQPSGKKKVKGMGFI